MPAFLCHWQDDGINGKCFFIQRQSLIPVQALCAGSCAVVANSSWGTGTATGMCHSLTLNFSFWHSHSCAGSGAHLMVMHSKFNFDIRQENLKQGTVQSLGQCGLAVELCLIGIFKISNKTSLSPKGWIRCRNSALTTWTQGTILSVIVFCGFVVDCFLMEVQQRHTLKAPGHKDTVFSLQPLGERDVGLPVSLHFLALMCLNWQCHEQGAPINTPGFHREAKTKQCKHSSCRKLSTKPLLSSSSNNVRLSLIFLKLAAFLWVLFRHFWVYK